MTDIANIRWTTLAPQPPASAIDLSAKLGESEPLIRHLVEAAAARQPVLILINDPHRATPTRPVLAALERLLPALPQSPRFRVIVAAGTHRFAEDEQRAFAAATLNGLALPIESVEWHDASAARELRDIAGVRLHRAIVESTFLLPIGSLEPHYFAGVTGAHKTVTIGCMSRDDIEHNHAGALECTSEILRLDGNPVHDGIVRVIAELRTSGKRIVAVNLVAHGTDVFAASVGHPLDTLHELLPFMRAIFVHAIPQPADILHLRVPWPLGRNFYQADKALKNNHLAVRDGGAILLDADCAEGIGPDHFMGLLRRAPDYGTARAIVAAEGYKLGDHKAVKLRHLTDGTQRGVNVALVSRNVSAEDADLAGMRQFNTLVAALVRTSDVLGATPATGLVIEDAGNTVVRAESA